MLERGTQAGHVGPRCPLSLASGTSQGIKGRLRFLRPSPWVPLSPCPLVPT